MAKKVALFLFHSSFPIVLFLFICLSVLAATSVLFRWAPSHADACFLYLVIITGCVRVFVTCWKEDLFPFDSEKGVTEKRTLLIATRVVIGCIITCAPILVACGNGFFIITLVATFLVIAFSLLSLL